MVPQVQSPQLLPHNLTSPLPHRVTSPHEGSGGQEHLSQEQTPFHLPAPQAHSSRDREPPHALTLTVVSSEPEAISKSLKGFHLMSKTFPLCPQTLG